MSNHTLIIGDCSNMNEIKSGSVQLVCTSPPYFNAPFDYKKLYKSYDHYLEMLRNVAKELFRVIADGRIVALNIDDMLVDGEKFPIIADATKIFLDAGFRYRDKITLAEATNGSEMEIVRFAIAWDVWKQAKRVFSHSAASFKGKQ